MSGFIALHREVTDHPLLFGDAQRLGAWCWLLVNACWKPTRFNVAGKIVTIERGQLCVSRSQLATAWGMSPSAVERFLTRLKTEQMIEQATGQGRSIITICNYEKYQSFNGEAGQATGQATGQPPDSHRTAKEQGNKGTIVEEEPIGSPSTERARAASAFPRPDWADPDVWSDFLKNRKAKRLPNTATAHRKLLKDITALANPEWPPGRLLEAIVARGWGAAYDPRPKDYQDANRNRQADGGAASGYRGPDRRDGFTRAIDRAGGFDQPGGPAGAARRPDAGDGSDHRQLAAAPGRTLLD